MRRILLLLLLSFFSVTILAFSNSDIYAQQCGEACSSGCDTGVVCMPNNACGRYCEASGPNCDQILDSYCDVANGYYSIGRGTGGNCTCQCVNMNDVYGSTCTTDSNCPSGYLCEQLNTQFRCRRIVDSCPPCTTAVAGEYGACTATMSCPTFPISWIRNPSPPCPVRSNICCVDPQIPPGGTRGCGQTCTSDPDCIVLYQCHPTMLRCYSTVNDCPTCTGTSGRPGICVSDASCNADGFNSNDGLCSAPAPAGTVCCTDAPTGTSCELQPTPPYTVGTTFWVNLTTSTPPNTMYNITVSPTTCSCSNPITTDTNGARLFSCICNQAGDYTITATRAGGTATTCSTNITTSTLGRCDELCETRPIGPYGFCVQGPVNWPDCENYLDDCANPVADCWCCPNENPGGGNTFPSRNPISPQGGCDEGSLDTAIGCLPVGDRNAFLAFILRWALGIAGGVSFILIIYSGFTIMTSGGDKRRLQSGKELLTAAIAGLMLLIFSVFILDFIGIRILRIPGL
jgi:hypothetical protein